MSNVQTVNRKCSHIEKGIWSKHATLRFTTEPPATNTTSYEWDLTAELCPFCSGAVYMAIYKLFQEDIKPG